MINGDEKTATHRAEAGEQRVVQVESAPAVDRLVIARERRVWGRREVVQEACFGSVGGAYELRER